MSHAKQGKKHSFEAIFFLSDRYKYFQMDSCDYHGNTPLHIAAANGKLDDVKYLLDDRKASPFVRNKYVVL